MILVLAVVGVGVASFAFALHPFGLSTTSCSGNSSQGPNVQHFTVTMSTNGYNNSKILGLPRPVMNVSLGRIVSIHIQNDDPNEAHGFTIIHYFEHGIALKPGGCYDLTFLANQAGNFTVFCQIFCTVHFPWMQEGELNVNP